MYHSEIIPLNAEIIPIPTRINTSFINQLLIIDIHKDAKINNLVRILFIPMKKSRRSLTLPTCNLEQRIREMNIKHTKLVQRFTHINTLPQHCRDEINKLTKAVEDHIELIRETEGVLGSDGKHGSLRPPRRSSGSCKRKPLVKPDSTDPSQRQKDFGVEALYKQQKSELAMITDELTKARARLAREQKILKDSWKLLEAEEAKLDEQRKLYDYNKEALGRQQLSHAEREKFEKEIEGLRLELESVEASEKRLISRLEAVKQEETAVEGKIDQLIAKDEDIHEEERKTTDKEIQLMQKLKEAEHLENVLKMKRQQEEEIELRLQGLILTHDVYNKRNWEELKIMQECMIKSQIARDKKSK